MKIPSLLALAATLLTAAFASATQDLPEPLLGYHIDDQGVVFQVPSQGCTSRDSFRLDTTDGLLTLVRIAPDACFVAMPWGTEVAWTWAELGLDPMGAPVRVNNPVTTHGAFRDGPTSWTMDPAPPSGEMQPELLYGYTIGEDGITFQVPSGGCTGADSFRVERSDDLLTLIRITPDYCEAYFPWGARVTLAPAELGIDAAMLGSVFVANPVGTHVLWAPVRSLATP